MRFSASNFASSSANLDSSDGLQYSIKGYAASHEARHFFMNDLIAHRSGYHILVVHLLVSSARAQSRAGSCRWAGDRCGRAGGVLQHVSSFFGLHAIVSSTAVRARTKKIFVSDIFLRRRGARVRGFRRCSRG